MKNFSKTLAAISMSLLTVGAMAQSQASYIPQQTPSKAVAAPRLSYHSAAQTKHKVGVTPVSGFIDYVDGDADNQSYTFYNGMTGNYTRWDPVMYMNSKFTAADTVFSPLKSNAANVYTANSCTVVFDTIWDLYAFLNNNPGFEQPSGGSVAIDTIWTQIGYHNTSGKNDTLVLTVCGVTKTGMPSTSPVYATLTEIIRPHEHDTLPGTSLDTVFTLPWVPSTPIIIPNTAVGGWHYCINATVIGSKKDTLGLTYYSAFATCNGGGYGDSTTSVGTKNGLTAFGATQYTNSFVTGLYWYNSKDFKGTLTQETFPLSSGAHQGEWVNGGGQQFYGFTPGGCPGFTFYPGVQNIAIFCSISYVDILGVNAISANGLSVSQNYPNPFNQQTTINYSLTKSSDVTFTVYDITGRVMTATNYGNVAPGQYQINLNAKSFSPGIYFYTFNVNGSIVTDKMVITQ